MHVSLLLLLQYLPDASLQGSAHHGSQHPAHLGTGFIAGIQEQSVEAEIKEVFYRMHTLAEYL